MINSMTNIVFESFSSHTSKFCKNPIKNKNKFYYNEAFREMHEPKYENFQEPNNKYTLLAY